MRDLSSRREILTVAELNQAAREAIEQALPALWVAGEISNFRRYDSGHCYFVLKDAQAHQDAVAARNARQDAHRTPAAGLPLPGASAP